MNNREVIGQRLREDSATVDRSRGRHTVEGTGGFRGTSPLGSRIQEHRADILKAMDGAGVRNPRVFGSVVRGEDGADSDVDLLVDVQEGIGLFDLARLELTIAEIIGAPVDVVPARALRAHLRSRVLSEAVPL